MAYWFITHFKLSQVSHIKYSNVYLLVVQNLYLGVLSKHSGHTTAGNLGMITYLFVPHRDNDIPLYVSDNYND